MKNYFLYNPLAGKGKAESKLVMWANENGNTENMDLTKIVSFPEFLATIDSDDKVIICGGDGTLNGFINRLGEGDFKNPIIYYPAGSGNDFMKDLGRTEEDGAFDVSDYIKNLPKATVDGKDFKFINGVGFGIDGLVCAEGDRLRGRGKKVNYTLLAVKCLLFGFKPVNATVIADGVTKKYKRVWMATTMKGKYFGGGMKLAPNQQRDSKDGKISAVIVHNLSKLRILMLFPSIFKGEHIKYTKNVEVIECNEFSVEYDVPCAMQIDGEPRFGITGYSATAKEKVIK